MTVLDELRALLDKKFGGQLHYGAHESYEHECCALELLSAHQGVSWTDQPEALHTWDFRVLNDVDVSCDLRTIHLLPVLAAYARCREWPAEKQCRVAWSAHLKTNHLISDPECRSGLMTAGHCKPDEIVSIAFNIASNRVRLFMAFRKVKEANQFYADVCRAWLDAAQESSDE